MKQAVTQHFRSQVLHTPQGLDLSVVRNDLFQPHFSQTSIDSCDEYQRLKTQELTDQKKKRRGTKQEEAEEEEEDEEEEDLTIECTAWDVTLTKPAMAGRAYMAKAITGPSASVSLPSRLRATTL